MIAPAIFGLSGPTLTAAERAFFADVNPLGFILFTRNCREPAQLRALTDSLRDLTGRADTPILIDQEGGRVTRLGPPHWRKPPAAAGFARLAEIDVQAGVHAIKLNARLIADDLHRLGINVDCLPVLDLPQPDAHPIIGDRALGHEPAGIARLGRATCVGLIEGGVLPVIKHIPGHGRATADSHEALPRVDTPLLELKMSDFAPFRTLGDMPLAMTAHVVYTAIDPNNAATVSPLLIDSIIREHIGFDGLLMSDDISANMKALPGTYGDRTLAALAAGCDVVLHCNGDMGEMKEVAAALLPMTQAARFRWLSASALARAGAPANFDRDAAVAEVDALLARVAA